LQIFVIYNPANSFWAKASVWPPEIPIVYHRRKQDGGSTSCCLYGDQNQIL